MFFQILSQNVLALLNIPDHDYNRKAVLTDYKVPTSLLLSARAFLFES